MAAKNAATAQQQPIDSGRPWFPVSAGLLTRKHYERLGAAWMEFLWFVHQQYAPKNGEVDTGVVRNGNLISYPEISAALGLPLRTVERQLRKARSRIPMLWFLIPAAAPGHIYLRSPGASHLS